MLKPIILIVMLWGFAQPSCKDPKKVENAGSNSAEQEEACVGGFSRDENGQCPLTQSCPNGNVILQTTQCPAAEASLVTCPDGTQKPAGSCADSDDDDSAEGGELGADLCEESINDDIKSEGTYSSFAASQKINVKCLDSESTCSGINSPDPLSAETIAETETQSASEKDESIAMFVYTDTNQHWFCFEKTDESTLQDIVYWLPGEEHTPVVQAPAGDGDTAATGDAQELKPNATCPNLVKCTEAYATPAVSAEQLQQHLESHDQTWVTIHGDATDQLGYAICHAVIHVKEINGDIVTGSWPAAAPDKTPRFYNGPTDGWKDIKFKINCIRSL